MMTGDEYRESLRKLKREIYYMGERIEDVVEHPATKPHVNAAAETYDIGSTDLGSTISHLSGERINRYTHIHHSADDLVKKVKMLRALGQRTGTCFQRCVGHDAINTLFSVTFDIDQKLGTGYHKRFLDYLAYIQKTDFMIDGAMTDPRGDRSLPPSKQVDPDLCLHIVERRSDGIVLRGAKAHQTGAVNSHEILVMPSAALGPEDTDYAVSCAVPADAPGLTYIFGRQSNDGRRLEEGEGMDSGNACYGIVGGEALIVFNNVFVPNERVFLCGEYEFAGTLVERFASYHRQNYGGCKTGVADVLIGACVAVAESQGTAKASHVRDKITEMVHLSETLYGGSLACSTESTKLKAGNYFVDPLLANTVKLNVTRFVYEIARLAQDIAGGFIATTPSERDLRHPTIGPMVEKYMKGVDGMPAEQRMRIGRLIENMTGGTALTESMHGAGSPQAMRVMILRQAKLDHKRGLALRIAGVVKDE